MQECQNFVTLGTNIAYNIKEEGKKCQQEQKAEEILVNVIYLME